ncbi:hypothetical protein Tco_0123787 [Tanacetum coccineum]
MKGLSECKASESNIRHIQVKNIVKEVKDYMKTYSSAEMDISCGKGKNKEAYAPKPNIPPPPEKENPAKDSIFHHFKKVGHWRMNCPTYEAKLRKKKNNSVDGLRGRRKKDKQEVGNEMHAVVVALSEVLI